MGGGRCKPKHKNSKPEIKQRIVNNVTNGTRVGAIIQALKTYPELSQDRQNVKMAKHENSTREIKQQIINKVKNTERGIGNPASIVISSLNGYLCSIFICIPSPNSFILYVYNISIHTYKKQNIRVFPSPDR